MEETYQKGMITLTKRDMRPNTVHHLISRIAHRVYFLKEEERKDFLDLMLRIADFCGIQLIGWCVMMNHFHILAYLPDRPSVLEDSEVLRRWRRIESIQGRYGVECDFGLWNRQGEIGRRSSIEALRRLRNRMYDISWFMKMVKQWFSERYNLANKHKGTLWESVYHDRVIDGLNDAARDCLCYIHLNPIRAGVTDDFDGYCCSSLCAARNGEAVPLAGLRMIYGVTISEDEMFSAHHGRMMELLTEIKMERAREIARARAAGIMRETDSLTDEAMVVQAATRIREAEQAIADAHARRQLSKSARERREQLEREIELIIRNRPSATAEEVMAVVEKPRSTVYRIIQRLRSLGRIAA